jgi:hypothetical protein
MDARIRTLPSPEGLKTEHRIYSVFQFSPLLGRRRNEYRASGGARYRAPIVRR